MKVVFLGSGSAIPSKERYCSSILLEVGKNRYLIDTGAPVADLLTRREIPFSSVKALFHTHCHGDHVCGSIHFLDLCAWSDRDADTEAYYPEETFACRVRELIESTGTRLPERVRIRSFGNSFVYRDDQIELRAIPNRHLADSDRPSYSFHIRAEGKNLLFTGDLSYSGEDFPSVAFSERFDLIVTECMHVPMETLTGILRRCRCGRVEIAHVFHIEKKKAVLAAAQKEQPFPFPVRMPEDNDEIIF